MKPINKEQLNLALPDKCCTATTGCEFDGSLRNVKAEPIYVQKVYDAALFNLQGLKTAPNQELLPCLGEGARIIQVLDIRCKKFFNPDDICDPRNLKINTDTIISGGDFVKSKGKDVTVVGPDGKFSEKIVYTDTHDCDEEGKGTPIFGTQNVEITGNVLVEIDVLFTDNCDTRCKTTLKANVKIAPKDNPLVLTNFFELCIPSVYNTAYLPRFAEFCNVNCEARLATNSIIRDMVIDPATGCVRANLLIALCIACEKKIVVPVQLCVLSTGFPQLSAEISPICSTFPSLFPKQIDESSRHCSSGNITSSEQTQEE